MKRDLKHLDYITERIKNKELPIYTLDLETDPFMRDRVPVPFAAGIYDGVVFRSFWSSRTGTCLQKVKEYMESNLEPGIVYAHNGGRFDFFYMLEWFDGKMMIINNRIVRAKVPSVVPSTKKKVDFDFRDSYAIMPFPLAAYQKEHIDMNLLTRENRHAHRAEINFYLKGDCVHLWDLCVEFQKKFGDAKTIASAAFKELTDIHHFEKLNLVQDELFRKHFFYGGRVQCFEKGYIQKSIKIYDVNSMYPYAMMAFEHPTGWCVLEDSKIWNTPKLKTFFLTVEGYSDDAFPMRKKNGGIEFGKNEGVFHVSIHEYIAAVGLGCFKPSRILATYNFDDFRTFHMFVDKYYTLREQAKKEGDKMHTLFYKFILNSAYGKFALNPDNYYDWMLSQAGEIPKGDLWEPSQLTHGKAILWRRKTLHRRNLNNVATGASITGAARSILLEAIKKSTGVLYCDTDSIMCESFAGGNLHETKLGAWKQEESGDSLAIAGKKMYALFQGTTCVKQASKGVSITPEELKRLCSGESITTYRDAPTFAKDGSARFLHRTVRMT